MTDVSEQLKNKIYAMVENVRREMIDLQPVQFVFFQQQYVWYWIEESIYIYCFSNI